MVDTPKPAPRPLTSSPSTRSNLSSTSTQPSNLTNSKVSALRDKFNHNVNNSTKKSPVKSSPLPRTLVRKFPADNSSATSSNSASKIIPRTTTVNEVKAKFSAKESSTSRISNNSSSNGSYSSSRSSTPVNSTSANSKTSILAERKSDDKCPTSLKFTKDQKSPIDSPRSKTTDEALPNSSADSASQQKKLPTSSVSNKAAKQSLSLDLNSIKSSLTKTKVQSRHSEKLFTSPLRNTYVKQNKNDFSSLKSKLTPIGSSEKKFSSPGQITKPSLSLDSNNVNGSISLSKSSDQNSGNIEISSSRPAKPSLSLDLEKSDCSPSKMRASNLLIDKQIKSPSSLKSKKSLSLDEDPVVHSPVKSKPFPARNSLKSIETPDQTFDDQSHSKPLVSRKLSNITPVKDPKSENRTCDVEADGIVIKSSPGRAKSSTSRESLKLNSSPDIQSQPKPRTKPATPPPTPEQPEYSRSPDLSRSFTKPKTSNGTLDTDKSETSGSDSECSRKSDDVRSIIKDIVENTSSGRCSQTTDDEEEGAQIVSGPEDLIVTKGQSAVLQLRYSGSPAPEVTWLKKVCTFTACIVVRNY